jgi:hypothetical protein
MRRKGVTSLELAKIAGVSSATISRAFSAMPLVLCCADHNDRNQLMRCREADTRAYRPQGGTTPASGSMVAPPAPVGKRPIRTSKIHSSDLLSA